MALEQPGPGEGFSTNITFVTEVVSQDVHGECRHGNIHFTTHVTFFGIVGIQATMCLLMP